MTIIRERKQIFKKIVSIAKETKNIDIKIIFLDPSSK
jgi:hypothetical protein